MTPERFIRNIVKYIEIKYDEDECPKHRYYFKDGKYMFDYSLETNLFHIRYEIWREFELTSNLGYSKLKKFLTPIIEDEFFLEKPDVYTEKYWDCSWVETHFKYR